MRATQRPRMHGQGTQTTAAQYREQSDATAEAQCIHVHKQLKQQKTSNDIASGLTD